MVRGSHEGKKETNHRPAERREFCKATASAISYLQFVDVARTLRELMQEEGLLTEEDQREVERRMKRNGHVFDDLPLTHLEGT